MKIKVKTWNIEAITGYKPITTFYQDFSIADRFGTDAVKDTYKNAVKEAETFGHKYLTELVIVLNWKIFEHHNRNDELAELYNDLWEQLSEYALDTLKGTELEYYLDTTD